MMKRIVTLLFFLGMIFLAACLVVPGFIDWNRHKDKITEQLSFYFQRRIDVAGNISLQILPQPEVMLEQVTVANAAGAKSVPLMTLKQLGIRIKFSPLLEGRIEVESLDLVEPVLNLEIPEGVQAGWTGVLREKPADVLGRSAQDVQLNRVSVINGALHYTNRATGAQVKIENVNLSVMAETLLGPYNIVGSLQYRNSPVNVELATEKYDNVSPVPVRVSFMPVSGLPQVRFNGVLDLQSGIDMQGEVSVRQGNLGSLFGMEALNRLGFMHETVDLRGVLESRGDQFSLSDIKAKFGRKGELLGKLSMQLSRDGKSSFHLDVEGGNLVITDQPGDVYIEAPDGFSGDIRGKGKNIVWGGYKLDAAEINADFDREEWRIKSASADLSGDSRIKLFGTASPAAERGAYAIQLVTDNLGKLAGALSPAENSIFRHFADTGMAGRFSLYGRLDVSPARISLYNMDAAAEDKMKLSGVVNIDRLSPKPNFVARLNMADWDVSSFPAGAYDGFLQKIMQSDADIELSLKNFTGHALKISDMSLKGKIGEQGFDFSYALKTARAGDTDFFLPPSLRVWSGSDLTGSIKGNAQKYSFSASGNAEGADVALSGDREGGAYRIDVRLKHPDSARALELLGLPIARLAGDGGAFDFSGELKGSGDDYRIDKIQSRIGAAAVSGALEKKDDKFMAELRVGKLDLDKWLAGDWLVKQDISLRLRGGELVWQGQSVADPQLTLDAGASSVKITNLEGTLWGGKLNAEGALTRQNKSVWSSSLKGSLKQADLNALSARLGLHEFSTGAVDVDFNLTSTENTPGTAVGRLDMKASTLKIEKFNFDKLGALIDQLTVVPPTLRQLVENSLRKNGATTFKEVQGRFEVDRGQIGVGSLKLSNMHGTVDVSGTAKAGGYKVSGDLRLSRPEGLSVIQVRCVSDAPECAVEGSEPIGEFIIKNNPAPVAVQPDVAPVPAPAEALPPVQTEDKSAVKDILKRLDEEGQKKPPP